MKITAEGFARTVVGQHTITDKDLTDAAVVPSMDGATIVISRSNNLGLSGHFRIRISLSVDEINQIARTATVTRLERKIEKLEAALAKLS